MWADLAKVMCKADPSSAECVYWSLRTRLLDYVDNQQFFDVFALNLDSRDRSSAAEDARYVLSGDCEADYDLATCVLFAVGRFELEEDALGESTITDIHDHIDAGALELLGGDVPTFAGRL
jgi:hypothetical protein